MYKWYSLQKSSFHRYELSNEIQFCDPLLQILFLFLKTVALIFLFSILENLYLATGRSNFLARTDWRDGIDIRRYINFPPTTVRVLLTKGHVTGRDIVRCGYASTYNVAHQPGNLQVPQLGGNFTSTALGKWQTQASTLKSEPRVCIRDNVAEKIVPSFKF